MHLFIGLPNPMCRANSTISGTVELRGDEDIDVQSITISLIGRAKTKVTKRKQNNTSYYRGRAPLISDSRKLFAGPNTLHPGHVWPFEFTLPPHCVARGQDPFKQPQGPLNGGRSFNYDPHQLLPPAFVDHHESFMMGLSVECFVSYVLEAKLIINRRALGPKDIDTTKTLNFITTRDIQTPNPEFSSFSRWFDCSSLALNPGHEDVPLTFKEKMKSLRTSKLPYARFALGLRYPQVAVIDKAISLSLSIDHNFEKSTTVAPPMVHLRKCSVHLVALTNIQAMRNDLFVQDGEKQSWDNHYTIDSCDFSKKGDKPPPVTEHMDLGELMKLKIPRGQAPTFSTFNIRRGYRLNIKVNIECAQQSFKAEFSTTNLVLLAAAYDAGPEHQPDATPATPVLREDESDDVAPAYATGVGAYLPTYEDVKNPDGAEKPDNVEISRHFRES